MPSPRFSTAGTHFTSDASGADLTSRESSPSMSAACASNRVKPICADTSRSRSTRTTRSIAPRGPVSLLIGRRRARKSAPPWKSSPSFSFTDRSVASSSSLIFWFGSGPPARRLSISAKTSSSARPSRAAFTEGRFRSLARSSRLSTCERKSSQTFATASRRSDPRSGREMTLRTCEK